MQENNPFEIDDDRIDDSMSTDFDDDKDNKKLDDIEKESTSAPADDDIPEKPAEKPVADTDSASFGLFDKFMKSKNNKITKPKKEKPVEEKAPVEETPPPVAKPEPKVVEKAPEPPKKAEPVVETSPPAPEPAKVEPAPEPVPPAEPAPVAPEPAPVAAEAKPKKSLFSRFKKDKTTPAPADQPALVQPLPIEQQPLAQPMIAPAADPPPVEVQPPAAAPAPPIDPARPGDIINSINSVPNPVQDEPKSGFFGKKKSKPDKSAVAIDGVSPDYKKDAKKSNAKPAAPFTPEYPQIQQLPEQPPQYAADQQNNYITPPPVYNQPYEAAPDPYQQPNQQPMIYQQPTYPENNANYYPQDNNYYPQDDMYANPLLNNQPLPVNPYTAPNIYDPYNPNATMVDLNPTYPTAKKPDWRFIATLGAAILFLAGMILFLILWNSANAGLSDATLQLEDSQSKANTGERAVEESESLKDAILQNQKDIEELQDKNDDLQKEADKVKDLEDQVDKLKKEKEELIDKNAELVLKQSNSSSSSRN